MLHFWKLLWQMEGETKQDLQFQNVKDTFGPTWQMNISFVIHRCIQHKSSENSNSNPAILSSKKSVAV